MATPETTTVAVFRRRSVALVAAAAVTLAMVACNPIRLEPQGLNDFTYTGPPGGWFEVALTMPDGYLVGFEMWSEGEVPHLCRDFATGAVEPCEGGSSDEFLADGTMSSRPVISPIDGDRLTIYAWCQRPQTRPLLCAEGIGVHLTVRVVDASGELIGDLARG